MSTRQYRFLDRAQAATRLEERADSLPRIVGYASVFYDGTPDTEYRMFDDVTERIMPGAFDRALKEDDVRGLFNHDTNALLGRSTAGTLKVSVDARGLAYDIDTPDTTVGRDVVANIKRGDLTGSSFGFVPRETTFREDGDLLIIERTDMELWDVGPVTFPAYDSTTTGVRGTLGACLRSEDVLSIQGEIDAWRTSRRQERDALTARAANRIRRARGLEVAR